MLQQCSVTLVNLILLEKPSVSQSYIICLVMSSWISGGVYELHILKVNISVEFPILQLLIYSSSKCFE